MWYARDMSDPGKGVNYGPFSTEQEAVMWLENRELPGYVHSHATEAERPEDFP